MPTAAITPELTEVAQEVHRRRLVSYTGDKAPDFKQTLAEVAVLMHFDRIPNVNDLRLGRKAMEVRPFDENGLSVRICWWERWPLKVFSFLLDADVYVFVSKEGRNLDIAGWLPINLVDEAPIEWVERDGKRIGYSHEIDKSYLAPLPEKFAFVDECKHLEEWMGMWDWSFNAWLCCGCQRYIHDAAARDKSPRLLAVCSPDGEVPPSTSGT